MKVIDFDGTVLDATFSLQPPEDGAVSIVFESSGGRAGGPNQRNLEYRRGLSVILERLQAMGATITEIRVETERTRTLPSDDQRVILDGRTFPLHLSTVGEDVESLRRAISRFARRVGQDADKLSRSGGSSRRLRFFLDNVPTDPDVLERQIGGTGAQGDVDVVDAVVELAAGRRRGNGQGFLLSQKVRKCVEDYAVRWAIRHYESEGWSVSDVGAFQSFDLLCSRGQEELRVEVKGTTTPGEGVILTPNEVTHAREQHPKVELFVVAAIVVEHPEDEHPLAIGGAAYVQKEWWPDDSELVPVGYRYLTGIGHGESSGAWSTVA
jgi:hypothetical protein